MTPDQSSKPRKKWITSKFLYNSFKSNEAYISVLVFKDATGSTHTGGEVRGCGTHGGTRAHLCREVEVCVGTLKTRYPRVQVSGQDERRAMQITHSRVSITSA
jgi:hypothetical protein